MSILDNLSRFIGIPPEPEIDEDFEPEMPRQHVEKRPVEFNPERMMPRLASIQVVKPRLNQDGFKAYSIRHYADLLKENNALILDIGDVAEDRIDFAKRLIDFLAGVTLAIGGTSKEINPNLFLFAPPNFIIGGDFSSLSDELEN